MAAGALVVILVVLEQVFSCVFGRVIVTGGEGLFAISTILCGIIIVGRLFSSRSLGYITAYFALSPPASSAAAWEHSCILAAAVMSEFRGEVFMLFWFLVGLCMLFTGVATAAYEGEAVLDVVFVEVVGGEVLLWNGACAFCASFLWEHEKDTATCASWQFKHFVSELVQVL